MKKQKHHKPQTRTKREHTPHKIEKYPAAAPATEKSYSLENQSTTEPNLTEKKAEHEVYDVEVDGAQATIEIKKEGGNKTYTLKVPTINKETEKFLSGTLIHDMLGLGKMEYLINDPHLEEIVVPSAKEPVKVYSKRHGWITTNLTIEKEEDILNYANIIARRIGRQITVLTLLLDAHLITGDRVNAVLYPIN